MNTYLVQRVLSNPKNFFSERVDLNSICCKAVLMYYSSKGASCAVILAKLHVTFVFVN